MNISAINNNLSFKGNAKTSIFYINDLHGQIPKMERLHSASEHAKVIAANKGTDFFKFSSGDTFIGSNEQRNIAAASFLNVAQIDAETLGNHEFDVTASVCGQLLKNSKTNILGMNLNFPQAPSDLSRKVKRSTIMQGKNGEKYGLIGIQPPDINYRLKKKSNLEGITVDDEAQTLKELQEEVDGLRKQGINKIILLSHGGNELEKKIAQTVNGIDVILGGHSHDLIKDVKEGENLFYTPEGEPVVITQAGRDGTHFGVLNLEFNDKGQIVTVQNNVMDTNLYSPNLIMSKAMNSILGESPVCGSLKHVDPLAVDYLVEENPWGDFVADALTNQMDVDLALINSANFRGSVDYGNVTERDISSIFPFENKLYKVRLSEKDLVDAIKYAATSINTHNHKPGILQVSGLTYKIDSQGHLLSLNKKDKAGNLTPIDINNPNPNKIYTAVYDEFLVNGGDNMTSLKRNESDIIEKYDYDKDKVTIAYIKTLNQPFEVRKDNRIQIVP